MRLTQRDLELLRFAAQHRLVLETHVRKLLGTSAEATRARLRALSRGGFLGYRRVFDGQPACCQIRRPGLAAVGSSLPPPRLDLGSYAHDVGAAWLWLAARRGTFGPLREVLAERTLRSADGIAAPGSVPHGVRLGGPGPRGHVRLHYPDLLFVAPAGQRIAVELELTPKGQTRRERILSGYAADRRIAVVLYLVEHGATGRAIEASARRLGISDRVQVQYFRWGENAPPGGRARATGHERPARAPAPQVDRRTTAVDQAR